MAFPSDLTQTQIDYLQEHGYGGQNREDLGELVAHCIKAISAIAAKLDSDAVGGADYVATVLTPQNVP